MGRSVRRAFVLAAGLGTRLRPLTERLPKPLMPVANHPLLGLLLDELFRLGMERVGVNVHHLSGCVIDYLRARPEARRIDIFHEREAILGTAGGLAQAREVLGDETLLAVNGDVALDFDLTEVLAAHVASGADASLVLHRHPGLEHVLAAGGRVVGFHDDAPPAGPTVERLAYTCVQVLEPSFFEHLPSPGRPGELVPAWRRLIAAGGHLRAHVLPGGHFWTDLGTPRDYLELHRRVLLEGRRVFGRNFPGPVILAPDARLEENVHVRGFACLGPGARAAAGARLEDAVLMAGAQVGPGAVVIGGVVGPGARLEGELLNGVA